MAQMFAISPLGQYWTSWLQKIGGCEWRVTGQEPVARRYWPCVQSSAKDAAGDSVQLLTPGILYQTLVGKSRRTAVRFSERQDTTQTSAGQVGSTEWPACNNCGHSPTGQFRRQDALNGWFSGPAHPPNCGRYRERPDTHHQNLEG